MRTWLRDAGAAFLAAGVVMALLLDAGGIWDHVGGDDLHGHLLPRYVERARALLHEHRLPLWNPWEYCGAPLLGEAQGLTFYLPAPLLFTSLTPYWALQGLYAFNCFVLAWGAIAYLRSHGIPRWGGVVAAWIATAGVFNTPRSMPAVIMTKVIPTAMMALIEVCSAMFSRLETDKKYGLSVQKMVMTANRPMSVPNCLLFRKSISLEITSSICTC